MQLAQQGECLGVRKVDETGKVPAKVTANAPDKTRFAAMAKRFATDTGWSIADRALQLHGGYGYCKDYRVERLMRDAKITQIWEGTNQVHRQIIGRSFLDKLG